LTPCSRKKQHRSYAQAAKLAGKHGRREHDELTVYRCLFCGFSFSTRRKKWWRRARRPAGENCTGFDEGDCDVEGKSVSDLVLRVKNWSDFQHYKDRSPAWIKLHRTLLDNIDFYKLSDCAGRTLILLWLIASENDGKVPEIKEAAWRLRMSPEKMASIYGELASGGFVVNEEEPAKEKWGSRYIPDTVRDEVLERDGRKCKWCSSDENLEIDHVVPVSQGGESVADNLQVLCRSCNRKKRTRTAESAEQVATQVRSPEKRREEDIQREQKPLAAVAAVTPKPSPKPELT
jgi:hypothetical protein